MLTIDNDLHKQSGWVKQAGALISGNDHPVVPDDYGWRDWYSCREFYTRGPAWANGLCAIHRPLQKNNGMFSLHMAFRVDANFAKYAGQLELDSRYSLGGRNSNFSSQFDQNKNGVWQISDQQGRWVNSGFAPGRFMPWRTYKIRFDYKIDATTQKYSFVGINLDGTNFLLPANLQQLTPTIPPGNPWVDGVSLQVQLNINGQAGGYSVFVDKSDYIWHQ